MVSIAATAWAALGLFPSAALRSARPGKHANVEIQDQPKKRMSTNGPMSIELA